MNQPYPQYKPSGLDWLGDIPQHWEVKKLKYVSTINWNKPASEVRRILEEEVVFLPMEKVSETGEINQETRKKVKDVLTGFTYFERNDVIVAKITPCFENGKGAFLNALETDFGYGSTEFHTIKATEKITPKFLYLITKSERFMAFGEAFMTGSAGQKRVPTSFIEHFQIGLPPLSEQTAIVDYLDYETARLDKLIGQKRELIKLLQEERAGLINEAVTHGLDHRAPRKDSGLPWLGEIPEHWEVKKLKYIAKIRYGLGQPPKQKDFGLPLIRATNVERGRIMEKDLMYIDPDDVPYDRDPILKEDDIIVVRSGAYTADSAIIPYKYDGSIAGYDMVVRAFDCLSKFIAYGLLSNYILINQLYPNRLRAAQPHLNKEELGETLVFLPPLAEQAKIVAYLDTETAQIDATIQKVEQEIGLLIEYRSALISEVVTGKLKVS